jgi:hypothetical protein
MRDPTRLYLDSWQVVSRATMDDDDGEVVRVVV